MATWGDLQERLNVVSFNACGVDAAKARRFTDTLEEEFRFHFLLVQEFTSAHKNAANIGATRCTAHLPMASRGGQPSSSIGTVWDPLLRGRSFGAGPFAWLSIAVFWERFG